jgi:diacylglycerol kinase family enzyme
MTITAFDQDAPLHIVCNAGSGAGDANDAQHQIQQILSGAGRRHDFILIEDPKQLPETARRAADAAVRTEGAVIVAGGDGTINAVAQAVLPTGRPFGIVPQGTFNYSSRAHGIPLDTAEATQALLSAWVKPAQVGLVNDRVFLVNASLGLYPQLLQDREEYKRQYGRRRSVAMWAGLMTLLREHRSLTVEIEHEGRREVVQTPSIFVGNNPLQLEQVGLKEAEDVQHRRLAAVLVQPVSTAKMVWLAVRGMLGRLGEDDSVRDFPFQSMTVQPLGSSPRRGIKVAVDGEVIWLQSPLRFRLAPQPLMLIVPAQPAPVK